MRLKKIKLAGFKSFVDPTSIPFPSDMTAIVGPNGCGKSNVIDAVRWVLGESSAKNLRGDAMTDVIFNGSSARKPVGQCSVELVFDNSAGRIAGEYAQYNELSIKRLVTREAVSTYFLNGTKCRRRDVTDLFLGTGLGPRSYAIIEQGMISRLIESKPQELRVFIEEAAGISKYKERRRETENRIRHTQDNLERLEDVRGELGKQLEKLQRQAAAAMRYKSLKATERTLKSELAALRWLKHSDAADKLEQQQRELQSELDALVAQQRGDEAGIIKYREQQLDLKAKLDTTQQALFSVGTAITRLEQNALHSKQRSDQIAQELQELHQLLDGAESELLSLAERSDIVDAQLEAREPEQALIEAQLFQAQEHRDTAETQLNSHFRAFRDQEQAYHSLKQQVQACHSQIQSTMAMQLRTEQRLNELKQEQNDVQDEELQTQIEALTDALVIDEEKSEQLAITLANSLEEVDDAKVMVQDVRQQMAEVNQLLQNARSSLAALQTMQQAEQPSEQVLAGANPMWQWVVPIAGAEAVVESALSWLGNPQVSEEIGLENLTQSVSQLARGVRYFDPQKFTTHKRENSLAKLVENDTVPRVFNQIHIAESLQQADSLLPQDSSDIVAILTEDGHWLGEDWLSTGAKSDEGVLQRAAKIDQLSYRIDELELESEAIQEQLQHQEQVLSQKQNRVDENKAALSQHDTATQQRQGQRELLQMQQQQAQSRKQKLIDDIERQSHQMLQEEQQLTSLSDKLEMLEAELETYTEQQQESQTQYEALQREVEQARANVERLTQQQHQHVLLVQQSQSEQQNVRNQQARLQQQVGQWQDKKTNLDAEAKQLSVPAEAQNEQLQAYLLEREEYEEQRIVLQTELSELDNLLQQAQQDQHGVTQQIQQRQKQIDALKLETEGFRVRATSVLEQLQETGLSLKSILESLSEDAEEKQWQAELEKTTSAIQRLGAVNLAAVEEYDIQAERKSHLDTQFDDLQEALDTLQSAIRKIDKETRSRFSDTFEQVNEDLKQLFPKVFGGGSAYLDLTDDDLLETGVTIMARPPGKKNSTIHLLSGGEKALTALSLVFAIFRLNPAPFCLLDEVDAPLDDANVGRFCKLVSEMSKTVQFIYITHNKIAMEMANHLTGVTMAEPGVSRMVAVDVDEAVAFAEA